MVKKPNKQKIKTQKLWMIKASPPPYISKLARSSDYGVLMYFF